MPSGANRHRHLRHAHFGEAQSYSCCPFIELYHESWAFNRNTLYQQFSFRISIRNFQLADLGSRSIFHKVLTELSALGYVTMLSIFTEKRKVCLLSLRTRLTPKACQPWQGERERMMSWLGNSTHTATTYGQPFHGITTHTTIYPFGAP